MSKYKELIKSNLILNNLYVSNDRVYIEIDFIKTVNSIQKERPDLTAIELVTEIKEFMKNRQFPVNEYMQKITNGEIKAQSTENLKIVGVRIDE